MNLFFKSLLIFIFSSLVVAEYTGDCKTIYDYLKKRGNEDHYPN